jgi:hypothetical protein
MPKKHASAVLIILLLLSITGTTFAQTEDTGVKEGDMYSYDVQFSSNVASLTNLDMLRMVAMRINVTRVNAGEIKYQNTEIFKNGTESTTDNSEYLYSKESPYVNWYLFYPANLSANDTVYIFGEHYLITETVLRNYAGVERETNHLVIDLTGLNTSSIPEYPEYNEYYDAYFDKKTGMAVELYIEQVNSDQELLNSLTLTIKESNVWVVPEFPSIMAISILMITVLAGSIIYKKTEHTISSKRNKNQNLRCTLHVSL